MAEIKYVTQEYVSYKPQIVDIVDPPKEAPVATAVYVSYSPFKLNEVNVSFTPAVTGGTATSYLVTAYELPLLTPTPYTGTGTVSPITVTGLASSKVYKFKVQGVNDAGPGPVSYPSNSIGFNEHEDEDDDHNKTNLGEKRDDHNYYWGKEN